MEENIFSQESNEELDRDWNHLQRLLEYCKSIGLKICDISRDYFNNSTVQMGMPTPIVHDGVDGIRMSYDKRRGLLIWFTNKFENPEDETRKKVKEQWDRIRQEN